MHRGIKHQVVWVISWCCLICAGNILAADNKPGASVNAGSAPAMSNAQAIRQALGEQATFEFQGVPLNDVAGEIAEKHHVQLMFDYAALKDGGIDPTTTLVTISVKDISLRSALKMILTPLGLTSIVKDEVLLITTKAKAASTYETRLYDVRDLIVHENDPGESPDFSALIDAIQSTVNPVGWDKAGGQGSVAPFSNNGICALMVWQNALGHEQIERLLEELRSIQPRRVYNQ